MNITDPDILFEDASIIVCYKPQGIPTQSGNVGTPDMVSILKNYLHKNTKGNKQPYLSLIHRLDQPVSGILVFAKTPESSKNLNAQLTRGGFEKYYLALVNGVPALPDAVLENYLTKDNRTNSSRVCKKDNPYAKLARLHYTLLDTRETGESLLRIHLDTGRHHQIRVQLSHIGCPIAGDTKYNEESKNKPGWQELKLSAYKLSFCHPQTKEKLTFEYPVSF